MSCTDVGVQNVGLDGPANRNNSQWTKEDFKERYWVVSLRRRKSLFIYQNYNIQIIKTI
ncbi:unnamed protein product [Nezara viridula]|uniref:Uncharacterized protein n=1 Tax=Nezara viridula TaxID=85310 RepID=A0A9P0HRK9_NEZVI|nr:unnamed protein product [Nezara viridula]